MLAELTLYTASLWLHITAAIIGFGSTFAEIVIFAVAMSGDRSHLPDLHRLGMIINRWVANPGLTVVVLTGVFQVIDHSWGFTRPWVIGGIAIALVLGGLIGSYFIPADRRLADLARRDIAASAGGEIALSDEYLARARRLGLLRGFAGLLVVTAVFLMVTKPGG